jgi:hypothetical protein
LIVIWEFNPCLYTRKNVHLQYPFSSLTMIINEIH